MARETTGPIDPRQEATLHTKAHLVRTGQVAPAPHKCWDNVMYVETDGALGQAYYCSICGALLQVG